MQRARDRSGVVTALDMEMKPKCITCGNTRLFFVTVREETSAWTTTEPMPEGAKVAACGRCRSRRSVIMDYSD